MVVRRTGRHGGGTASAGGPPVSGSGRRPSRRAILLGGVAAVALAAVSTVVVAGAHGLSGTGACTVPALPGTVVQVVAVDMARMTGGGMMRGTTGNEHDAAVPDAHNGARRHRVVAVAQRRQPPP
jgi:hypothetical protein